MRSWLLAGVSTFALACSGAPEGATETSSEELTAADSTAVLRLVNNAPDVVLRHNFASLADALVLRRNGADGVARTADDAPFTTAAQVKGLVGPSGLAQLAQYAHATVAAVKGEPKLAPWAGDPSGPLDLSMSTKLGLQSYDCRTTCVPTAIVASSFRLHLFDAADGERYLVVNDQHLGRVSHAGAVGIAPSNDFAFKGKLQRNAAQDYVLALPAYGVTSALWSNPVAVDVLLVAAHPAPSVLVELTTRPDCTVAAAPMSVRLPADNATTLLRFHLAAGSPHPVGITSHYGDSATLQPGDTWTDTRPHCGVGIVNERVQLGTGCGQGSLDVLCDYGP